MRARVFNAFTFNIFIRNQLAKHKMSSVIWVLHFNLLLINFIICTLHRCICIIAMERVRCSGRPFHSINAAAFNVICMDHYNDKIYYFQSYCQMHIIPKWRTKVSALLSCMNGCVCLCMRYWFVWANNYDCSFIFYHILFIRNDS